MTERSPSKATPRVIRRNAPPTPVITGNDEVDEFRRRIDFYGNAVPAELVIEHRRDELKWIRRR